MNMVMVWMSADQFFSRLEGLHAAAWARFDRLEDNYEEMMQDYPGRPLTQTVEASELGKFTQRTEALATLERNSRRADSERSVHGGRRWELYSMRAAEELRKSFKPKKPKKKHLSHVRPVRPVPPALVQWAQDLGVTL